MPPKVGVPARSPATPRPIPAAHSGFYWNAGAVPGLGAYKTSKRAKQSSSVPSQCQSHWLQAGSSRGHSELINNPNMWEAGHISSDKLGGNGSSIIQSAWENQVQNISVEHPRVGGAAWSTIRQSRSAAFRLRNRLLRGERQAAWLPAGTSARAPVNPIAEDGIRG